MFQDKFILQACLEIYHYLYVLNAEYYIQQYVSKNTVEYRKLPSSYVWDDLETKELLIEIKSNDLTNEQILCNEIRHNILKTNYPTYDSRKYNDNHDYPRVYRRESFDNKIDSNFIISNPQSKYKAKQRKLTKEQQRLVKLANRKNGKTPKIIKMARIDVNDAKLSPFYCSNNKTKHKHSWGTDNAAIPDSIVKNKESSSHDFKITLVPTGNGNYDISITYQGNLKRIKDKLNNLKLNWIDAIIVGSFTIETQQVKINRNHKLFTERFTTVLKVQEWVLSNSPKPIAMLATKKVQTKLYTTNMPQTTYQVTDKSPYTQQRKKVASKVKYC